MRPSSKASRDAAASSIPSDGSQPPFGTGALKGVARRRRSGEGTEAEMRGHSQTQLFGLLRLVMTSTLLADLAMGMAQQTTRGVERPLLLIVKQADGAQSVATWSWRDERAQRWRVLGCGCCLDEEA